MQLKFYACPHCGNQLLFLNRMQPPAPCCCRAMEELHPNTCGSPDVHIPVVTQTGGGAVVVEQVFSWPGLGLMTMSAITSRDYPVIMGVCLFTAVVVLLGNLVTDILYAVADPTISFQKGGKK